jgi:membrane associated rhomboid family serine protease
VAINPLATWGRGVLRRAFLPLGVLVGVMWVEEIVDTTLDGRLDSLGIEPREADGLTGVVAAPFLHAGFAHLIANTVGLVVLGALLALSTRRFWEVCAIVTVAGGFAVWLTAPSGTLHIGASGLVYGIAAFLVARAFFERRLVTGAIAVVVVLLYGGLVLGVLPNQPGVSWQSHLFGALAGVAVAWSGLASRRAPAAPGILAR